MTEQTKKMVKPKVVKHHKDNTFKVYAVLLWLVAILLFIVTLMDDVPTGVIIAIPLVVFGCLLWWWKKPSKRTS